LHPRNIAALFGLSAVALTLAASAGAHRSVVQTVAVTAGKPSEFKFTVVPKSVRRGAVVFRITNSPTGSLPHDFKICSSPKGSLAKNTCVGKTSKTISPGVKTTLSFTFKTKGTYEYLCTIPGHAAAGMKGLLKVT
jgi:uncharacterized cupredoxin-like copper-binding protein